MERLNKNTVRKEVEGKTVYQVVINGEKYQSCCICEEYFKMTGYSNKYCTDCAKKQNIKKTAEKNKEKYWAKKSEQSGETEQPIEEHN
jgi:hypothetical protein